MATASAAFELAPDGTTYGATPQEVDAAGATVRCRLLSVAGVSPGKIRWTCEGTNNSNVAKPTISLSGSPNGQIASFTIPSGTNQAYIIQCEVNGGPDVNGSAATRARGKFYVQNDAGREPIAYFETTESNATHGTFELIDLLNNTAGSGAADAAAGIGTPLSPGVLRGIVGSDALKALHVGGFWSLADSGGGSFYWDATDTTDDDLGTTVRPTAVDPSDPGRWKRIYSGALHVDWFGARGDADYGDNTNGTDDHDAIQAALDVAAATAQRLIFFPKKVYKSASPLDVSETTGLVIDGLGGYRFTNGARIKFTGAHRDCMFRAFSCLGFEARGLTFDVTQVTLDAEDFTYANSTAREASTHTSGDLGKIAKDTDTGLRYQLYDTPSSWHLAPMSIFDSRHKYWGDIGGTEGGDSSNIKLTNCVFAGNTSYLFTFGVRLSQTLASTVEGCNFVNLQYGVAGVDGYYGFGYSNGNTIDKRCVFQAMQKRGVYNPGQAWVVDNNTFETSADGSIDGVLCDRSGCVAFKALGNWHGDGTGGTAYELFGVKGLTLDANFVEAAGTSYFAKLTSCDGTKSLGNSIYSLHGYLIQAGTPCYGLNLHDYFGGSGTYLGGTNYVNSVVHYFDNSGTLGGLSIGDQNSFTGLNALNVGRLNTAAAFSAAIGFSNTATAGGLTTGNAGVAHNNSERCVGGGTKLGTGGSQGCELVLTNQVLTGATTNLLNPSQASPGMVLTASHAYKVTAEWLVTNISGGIAATGTIEALIKKTSGGTATIVVQGTVWKDYDQDPGATGITAAFVLTSNNLDVAVTNPTGSTVNANAYLSWAEMIA
jgi:hypothetical protein